MNTDRAMNRKLLVSVFNPQEAHEAMLGGGRIIDSEDPRSALGNIKPQQIMAISDAVLAFRRDLDVQLSTNIGEDQLLFDRSDDGTAIEKSPYEIAGKAAQAALGVAVSMGTGVHPCGIVKVGLDGMSPEPLIDVLSECVQTLRRTDLFSHTQVMSVLFAQDLDLWEERCSVPAIRRALVSLREFHPCAPTAADGFDLAEYAVGTLRDAGGAPLFTDSGQVNLRSLIEHGVLPAGTHHTTVALSRLFPHAHYGFTDDLSARRTNRQVIARMVEATARAGAGAMMLDTSVLLKVARVGLVATERSPEMVDLNSLDVDEDTGLERRGILALDDIRFFVDYCHYHRIEANLAGSMTSYQAQQIWHLVPQTDQISTRGGASALTRDPYRPEHKGEDSRRDRGIVRNLVRGLVPPEQGGYLWLPQEMNPQATRTAREVLARSPGLTGYWADKYGDLTPVAEELPMTDLVLPAEPDPRVPPLPADRADVRVRSAYDKSIRTWGVPNNLFRTMAWLPGLALTEVDYANSFIFDPPRYAPVPGPPGDPATGSVLFPQGGFVDRVTKELVINLVSLLNRSRYSVTHHTYIGYTTLCAELPHEEQSVRAARAEEMLLHLVDSQGRPDWQDRSFIRRGRTEPLYTEAQTHCLRLAETIQRDPHSVTDEQFAEVRAALRSVAAEDIAKGPLAGTPGTDTAAYLNAWVNAMIVELTWCISHFSGLLNAWFTVLRVADETGTEEDGTDFVTAYNTSVPDRIKVRNNHLLGPTGWGHP